MKVFKRGKNPKKNVKGNPEVPNTTKINVKVNVWNLGNPEEPKNRN